MNDQENIHHELSRIKDFYRQNDSSSEYTQQYLPLLPMPLRYHQQLMFSFAESIFKAGYKDLKELTVLDVGCGGGRFLGDLLGFGGQGRLMYGTDLMFPRLRTAKNKYPAVNFICTDGVKIPFFDAKFDLIAQNVVFSSIADIDLRQKIVKEMLRVLKPGGYIWYWDIFNTIQEAGNQPIIPSEIFPGLPIHSKRVSWLPLPSETLSKRRWKLTFGWFVNLFAAKPTHIAALIGPKPE